MSCNPICAKSLDYCSLAGDQDQSASSRFSVALFPPLSLLNGCTPVSDGSPCLCGYLPYPAVSQEILNSAEGERAEASETGMEANGAYAVEAQVHTKNIRLSRAMHLGGW